MNIGDDYEVLFLQGGASLQFAMLPYNLLSINGKASYLDTGTWASGAIKEAKKVGNVEVIDSHFQGYGAKGRDILSFVD